MTTESVAAQAEMRAAGLPALLGASPVLPLLLLVPLLMRTRSSVTPTQAARAVSQDSPEPPAAPEPPGITGRSAGSRRSLPITERFPDYGKSADRNSEPDTDTGKPSEVKSGAEVVNPPVARRSFPDMDLLGFLSDAAPYIPGMNANPIARIIQAREIADQIRSFQINPIPALAAPAAQRTSEIPLGLISAVRRNMRSNIPSTLSKTEQIIQLVKTLQSGGGNMLQSLTGLAQSINPVRTTGQIESSASLQGEDSRELDGPVGNALSRALVNMDDKKRQQFIRMAQDMIDKMK
ncbi:MAG: hypothetical protein GX549_08465 [Clostridiales bacterium]|nr:hypothetical protein [Clostridiales bacterium]